jgi:hypothetical protein
MDNRDLTSKQVKDVEEIVGRFVRFLSRMLKRMDQLGFVPTDQLYKSTTETYGACRRFLATLQEIGCESARGRPAFKRPTNSRTKPET